MPDELRLLLALLGGGAISAALCPAAIRLSRRTGVIDHPGEYRIHDRGTPCLGSLPVLAGFALAAAVLAPGSGLLPLLIGGGVAVVAIGVADDRLRIPIWPRLAVQLAVGTAVWVSGFGWELFDAGAVNALITVAWVLGITNAFNLIDNMDGAAGALGACSAAGTGALATANGALTVGVICFALAGACIGFLRFNLARPSRIFLGDGGSTLIGFGLAVAIANMPFTGATALPILVPLVGIVLLDTGLVIVSRIVREVPVLRGGRDHITHRLLTINGDTRTVIALIVVAQALLCGLAALMSEMDSTGVWAVTVLYLLAAAVAIAILVSPEARRRRHAGRPIELQRDHAH